MQRGEPNLGVIRASNARTVVHGNDVYTVSRLGISKSFSFERSAKPAATRHDATTALYGHVRWISA